MARTQCARCAAACNMGRLVCALCASEDAQKRHGYRRPGRPSKVPDLSPAEIEARFQAAKQAKRVERLHGEDG